MWLLILTLFTDPIQEGIGADSDGSPVFFHSEQACLVALEEQRAKIKDHFDVKFALDCRQLTPKAPSGPTA